MLRKAERPESFLGLRALLRLCLKTPRPAAAAVLGLILVSPVKAAEPSKFVSFLVGKKPGEGKSFAYFVRNYDGRASRPASATERNGGPHGGDGLLQAGLRLSTSDRAQFPRSRRAALDPGRIWRRERARFAPKGRDLRRHRRRRSACGRKQEIRPVEFAARPPVFGGQAHLSRTIPSTAPSPRTTDISVSPARRSRNARTKRSTLPRKPSSIGIAEGKAHSSKNRDRTRPCFESSSDLTATTNARARNHSAGGAAPEQSETPPGCVPLLSLHFEPSRHFVLGPSDKMGLLRELGLKLHRRFRRADRGRFFRLERFEEFMRLLAQRLGRCARLLGRTRRARSSC